MDGENVSGHMLEDSKMPEYCPVRNFETCLEKLRPQCNRLWQFTINVASRAQIMVTATNLPSSRIDDWPHCTTMYECLLGDDNWILWVIWRFLEINNLAGSWANIKWVSFHAMTRNEIWHIKNRRFDNNWKIYLKMVRNARPQDFFLQNNQISP